MPQKYLKVVRIETWPDKSVRLVLENGHSVHVKRISNSHSSLAIDREMKRPDDERDVHDVDVDVMPDEGSVAF